MEDDDNTKLFHHPQHYSSSSSSMTLFSRLDHLDFVMKDLEKKQRLGRFGGSNLEEGMERRCISLDVALKDTYFKGSLLDRVASLENRLFQLCLEMDSWSSSSNPSSLTSSQTSVEIHSSSSLKQFCKGQSSSSYPIFHYPNHGRTTSSQISQIQEKPQRQQLKKKQQSPSKGQVVGKTKTEKDEVGSCKNVKKEKGNPSLKWPHLRMFGC